MPADGGRAVLLQVTLGAIFRILIQLISDVTVDALALTGGDEVVAHHTDLQGAALAKKLNVTPAAPSDDPVMPMAQDETNTLNSTAKGKDFDKAYIDDEVKVHKAVLDLATKAAGQTQNAELKNLIQKAAPVIQGHLTKAESIQKTLK